MGKYRHNRVTGTILNTDGSPMELEVVTKRLNIMDRRLATIEKALEYACHALSTSVLFLDLHWWEIRNKIFNSIEAAEDFKKGN
jgi:hypothetical protein